MAQNGYLEIGMDHFALENDSMYESFKAGNLHRNFMGYTASKTKLMIGLGVSSISDSWYSFAQNEKTIEEYYARLEANELPIFKGHVLNSEDLVIRKHILNLMCQFTTSWENEDMQFAELNEIHESLKEMEADGLLTFKENGVNVTEKGTAFVRNICMAFDLRLIRKAPETKLFSMTI